ncbi:MAG: zinc ribbon domain-containing protein [Gemmatimonadetes bacterium]|nr:zinc ribbon domain-containing protein [Gemmatimonadota bacterium]
MIYEAIAAVLVALAVVALLLGPLLGGSQAAQIGADEPEDLEETPKGMALAALREIEFDRATGKLSDEDYAALKAKYTAEALEVLRREAPAPAAAPAPVAAGATGDAVEALIADRVRALEAGAVKCPACGPRPEGDALFCSGCGRSLTIGGCGSCGAALVPGSRFCESCGSAVAQA